MLAAFCSQDSAPGVGVYFFAKHKSARIWPIALYLQHKSSKRLPVLSPTQRHVTRGAAP